MNKATYPTNPIKPQVIANAVSEVLKDNAIVSVDSGNNTVGQHDF